jgi:hypothetical protein
VSRRLEYTLAFDVPAETLYAVYASGEYWQTLMDRYDELTPGKSDITEFRADAQGIEVAFRQVLPHAEMPAILRTVIPLDMAITRRQCFGPFDGGGASGHYAASISHAPGRLDGRYALTGGPSGCRLRIDSTCKVAMPLIGGKLEDMVMQTVNDVFTVEEAFTADWIAEHL